MIELKKEIKSLKSWQNRKANHKNITKMSINDLNQQTVQQLEQQRKELDRMAKMLAQKDLELVETRAKLEKEAQELDKISKILARRELELSEVRKKREAEFKELKESSAALMNILEDMEATKKELAEERDITLAVINNFSDGLLLFNNSNKLILINPQAEIFLNVKGKDIIGKPPSGLSAFNPRLEKLVKMVYYEGIVKTLTRQELSLSDNLILEVSSVSLTAEEGGIGALVVLHDVTREKLVERMKTEFVSIAAHQLRTPLSAIKWTLRMILDGELGEITPEQKNFLKRAYQSNERMIYLINDLLNVSRIEEGRYIYKTTLTGLEVIVQSVIDSLKEAIERKGIKLSFRKPDRQLPLVSVDVEKITLAIQNILDNAVRYTPKGGQVTISLAYGKKEIECSISDNGVGIPKNQQKRVFQKFFRGTNVVRKDTEGTGLGLFIAKNIIDAHGGKIWFSSEEGKGTTFYWTLPINSQQDNF